MNDRDKAEELLKKNLNFPYWIIKTKFPDLMNDDDAKQEALISLWKACLQYDETRSNFSTFAYRVIYNDILIYLRSQKRQKRLVMVSLEDPVPGTEEFYIADLIEDPAGGPENEIFMFHEFYEQLPERTKHVFRLALDGYNQSQIGVMLGLSQSYVSRIFSKALKEYQKGQYHGTRAQSCSLRG